MKKTVYKSIFIQGEDSTYFSGELNISKNRIVLQFDNLSSVIAGGNTWKIKDFFSSISPFLDKMKPIELHLSEFPTDEEFRRILYYFKDNLKKNNKAIEIILTIKSKAKHKNFETICELYKINGFIIRTS